MTNEFDYNNWKSEIDYKNWEREMMEKFGWYIHFVPGDDSSPTGFNAHTHGIVKAFDHPDLQIVVPLPQKICGAIFHGIVDQIKKGKVFKQNIEYENVLADDLNVMFHGALECERAVLRVILPDSKGNIKSGTFSDKEFQSQYE